MSSAKTWSQILKQMTDASDPEVIAAANSGLTPEKRQITPATTEDMTQMKELGEKAAQAQDEVAAIMGPISEKMKAYRDQLMGPVSKQLDQIEEELDLYKKQLLDKMLSHGTKNLRLNDRAPIEVVTKKDRSLTRKELIRVLNDKEGARVWNSLTVTEKHSLKIPEQTPPEA